MDSPGADAARTLQVKDLMNLDPEAFIYFDDGGKVLLPVDDIIPDTIRNGKKAVVLYT